ncbi:cell division protein FtsQ/DivIB [Aquidulcibacter paucihalophilus]|jgi:nucleoside phosphorylase|nr:cell division protein FtsQ/DivIB [Aquidulcibacter paucihalophilus]
MSLISGLAALAAASTLSTQAVPPQDRPETLERLMACRGIADNTARLACFDTAAGALDTAQRQGDLVVIDRAGVAETRRQLFGFEMPSLPRLFGPEGAVEIESIESTLQSASLVGEGRWVFRLADGSVWRQIDSERVRFQNRPGQTVRVRKASLGSFLLTVDDSRAVRVRRQ